MFKEIPFDRHYYAVPFLWLLFGFELLLGFVHLVYIFSRIPIWGIRDFYPIRVMVMYIVLVMIISFMLTTALECMLLKRDKLHPTTFLRYEVGKAFTIGTWAWIMALCLATTLEHHPSHIGNFACGVHALIIALLLAGLPYALVMYVRDLRGHFCDRPSSLGWRYVDGNWVKEGATGPRVEQTSTATA